MADAMLGGIEAVRRFSRFYTRRIGVSRRVLNGSEFSLTEARIMYELAHRETATASDLAKNLELNPGYLSRRSKSSRNAASSRARRQWTMHGSSSST